MNNAEKLASFAAEAQANIRRVGESFEKPDDDWLSVAFLQNAEGVHIIAMDGTMFADENSKDMLAMWLKAAMGFLHADRYAVLFNTYGLKNPSKEDWEQYRQGKRLSEFPNACEQLLLIAGDVEQELCFNAAIERDGTNPPTLGEWELMPDFDGRFAHLNERMRTSSPWPYAS